MEKLLDQIRSVYELEELDAGEFSRLKVQGMKFRIRCFHASGLGHVSVMTASGFFGLMNMQTLILNPFEQDMPLCSYDRIRAMGKDSLYLELYNTMVGQTDLSALDAVVQACGDLPSFDPGSHWYDPIKLPQSLFKRGKKQHTAAFDKAASDFLAAYLQRCRTAPAADETRKKEQAAAYSEGLLEHGGPAVNVFLKHLGAETTAKLFRTVLFGV